MGIHRDKTIEDFNGLMPEECRIEEMNLQQFAVDHAKKIEGEYKEFTDETIGEINVKFYETMCGIYPKGTVCRARLDDWWHATRLGAFCRATAKICEEDEIWKDIRANDLPKDHPAWDCIEEWTGMTQEDLTLQEATGEDIINKIETGMQKEIVL